MQYVTVCRHDCKPLKKEISGLGRIVKVRRFKTVEAAERFIEKIAAIDKKGVHNGDYSIDAPEIAQVRFIQLDQLTGPRLKELHGLDSPPLSLALSPSAKDRLKFCKFVEKEKELALLDLAHNIADMGQERLATVESRGKGKKYTLVDGFRRALAIAYAAIALGDARSLAMRCDVRPQEKEAIGIIL